MSEEDSRPEAYDAFVAARMAEGDTPNDVTGWIEDALRLVPDWGLFGDGRWRRDTVCSICGNGFAGICGHKGDPSRRIILRSEWEAQH